jgi:hypothetical protein
MPQLNFDNYNRDYMLLPIFQVTRLLMLYLRLDAVRQNPFTKHARIAEIGGVIRTGCQLLLAVWYIVIIILVCIVEIFANIY